MRGQNDPENASRSSLLPQRIKSEDYKNPTSLNSAASWQHMLLRGGYEHVQHFEDWRL